MSKNKLGSFWRITGNCKTYKDINEVMKVARYGGFKEVHQFTCGRHKMIPVEPDICDSEVTRPDIPSAIFKRAIDRWEEDTDVVPVQTMEELIRSGKK